MALSVGLGATGMRGMDRSSRDVNGERDGGDANLEEPAMQSAQARDDARRDSLASQLGAGATDPCDATATTDESSHRGGGAPVVFQAPKATLVQQLGWQCLLGEGGAFLCCKEVASEVIGLGGGMNRAQDDLLLSVRSRKRQ